jgi:hypothetical protein
MNPRFLSALLVAASVHLASATAAGQEEQASPSIRIVTPSRLDGSVDVLWRRDDSPPPLQSDDEMQEKLASGFRVYAEAAGAAAPMAGNYEILEDRFRFTPRFPLREGTRYAVSFDEGCVFAPAASPCEGEPKPDIAFTLKGAEHAVARVSKVEPQADCLPANLLRFYVHFSESMARGDVYKHISLIRADGSRVPSPFLNLSWNLWDVGQQRLTVLLDPGRIKRGVGPNLKAGPPLAENEAYTLRVGPGLRDARGRILPEAFEKHFIATAPVNERLDPDSWLIAAPASGSREPLRVVTRAHIDSGLLDQMIKVSTDDGERIAGGNAPSLNEPGWQFTPDQGWRPGTYRIEIRTEIEDVSGNSAHSALDTIAGRSVSRREDKLSLSFEVEPSKGLPKQDGTRLGHLPNGRCGE